MVAEREETVVQPDRTSYSIKNMTTASGGSAVDVLRNIPLVEVDGSNNVSLRGNANVVIQVNGRATPLKGDQLAAFLAQLPANALKTVEVSTNPSAKDDPEGTAGLINIVLNQEAELGLSGGMNAGTSSTGQVNASGNIGKQQGKVTGFASMYYYSDHRANSGTISRTNLVTPDPAFVETNLDGRQQPLSLGGNLRGEYRFNETDALTMDSYFWSGHWGGQSASAYTDLDSLLETIGQFSQLSDQFSHYLGGDMDVAFRRQGKPTDPQLTIEADVNTNHNDNNNDLSGLVTHTDPTTPASIPTERDHTVGTYPAFNGKVDYSHPFNAQTKLEMGGKYLDRGNASEFTAAYLDPTSDAYTIAPARSTSFSYREHIGGAYLLFSRAFGKLQTQEGMRVEDARALFDLPLSALHFDRHYASIYPSGVLTWNFTDMRSAKMSYSRRVSRPNPYQLNPIEYRQDARNVFHGNPELNAEYTDALDFSFMDVHSWGSVQLSPYMRHTAHAVRNIQFVDTTGMSVSTFANVASTTQVGTDASVQFHQGPVTLSAGGSAYHYSSDAGNLTSLIPNGVNLSTSTMAWALRQQLTWKVTPILDAQMSSAYAAPRKTEGGSTLASVNMSTGLRYKAWGDAGSIALRVNDPFRLQKWGYRTANGSVVELSERYFGARAVYLSITRNFGQALKLKPKSDTDSAPSAPFSLIFSQSP